MPVNIVFELFDTLIKPILWYACEIWGSKMGSDIEKMHINFIKTVLGVKPSTNTCSILCRNRTIPIIYYYLQTDDQILAKIIMYFGS